MANKQYVLGRGELYFDPFTANTTTKTGERFVGNVTAFSFTIESESLDHFDSTQGIRQKDDSVLLEVNRTGTMTTDNINKENMALFILGDYSTQVQTSGTVTDESLGAVQQDRYYQVGASSGNPTGVRSISAVTVKVGAAVKTISTDYTIDLTLGRLYIVSGGGIANNDVVLVTYTKAATTRDQIKSASGATIDGALRWVAKNPKGPVRDVYFPSCRLSPNGEFQLLGDEWQAMSFNIDVQKLDDTTESIYIDGRPA